MAHAVESEDAGAARSAADRPAPARVRRALVAAFAAVAIAFTVGLAAAHTFVAEIRSAATEITRNSAPSISNLSAMRSALRQLEVLASDHLAACGARGCGGPPARIPELLRELHRGWDGYRLLPTFPGEKDLWPTIDAELDGLGELLALTLEAAAAGRQADAAALRDRLAPAFDRLDGEIARIVESDHAQGLALAARIDRLADLSTGASVVLDLLTVALTVLAAAVALRLVRRYERTLQARADDLEQFAGRVAHDLKGPLASTAAALHAARRLSPDAAHAAIDRGERGVRRVQRLVDDLLEFARAGARRQSREVTADVHEVVEDVLAELRELAERHRVEVRVEDAAHERVACSPGVLTSIVENLVRNAITHMGERAVRVVRVRAPPGPAGAPVRIEVEDTGPGIPGALGDRVFEPFVRGSSDVEGSGLGLATVKRFVSAHGGRVGFSAQPGQGTLFWLELPRPPAASPDARG